MNSLKRIIIATIALALFLNASQRYENNDGVIIDLATTLQWQDKYDNDVPSLDWNNALLYCNNLSLNGYEDWRLPNINELSTIIDYSKPTSIDDIFQTPQSNYWTSTISELNNAYRVQFNIGSVYTYSISNELSVRCVRSTSIKNEILTSVNLFNENFKDNTKATEPFVKSWTFNEDISSFDIEIVGNTYNTILESEFIKNGTTLSVKLTPDLSNDENKLELRFKDASGNIVKVDYSDTFWSLTRTQNKDTFNIEEIANSVSITQDNKYSYYSDIEVGDASFESVIFATLKAVVNGQDDPNDNTKKIFRPNDNVSWAEALKMVINGAAIANEIELPNYEYILNTYPSWAGKYYTYARENNAMSFISEDLSTTNLTREDISRLLVKVLHLEDRMEGFPPLNGDDIEFSDKDDFSSSEYYEYGKIVRAYGLFMTNDIANPSGSITRAQLAEVVSKIFMIPKASINTVDVIEYGQTLSIGKLINKKAMKINECCATDISSDSSDDIVVQYAVNGVIQSDNSIDTFNLNIGENKIIALIDNNGVREFISKDFVVSYTDSDNDGVQDIDDTWVDDERYSSDVNDNGIPDILDFVYDLEDKSSAETIQVGDKVISIANIIADGGYTIQGNSQTISILKGWNLISANIQDISTISTKAKILWKYKDNTWSAFSNDTAIKTLIENNLLSFSSIENKDGFWILANEDFDLEVLENDTVNGGTYSSGWHLVGSGSDELLSNYGCVSGELQSAWKYKDNKWLLNTNIENTLGFESFDTLYANEGFWLHCE